MSEEAIQALSKAVQKEFGTFLAASEEGWTITAQGIAKNLLEEGFDILPNERKDS